MIRPVLVGNVPVISVPPDLFSVIAGRCDPKNLLEFNRRCRIFLNYQQHLAYKMMHMNGSLIDQIVTFCSEFLQGGHNVALGTNRNTDTTSRSLSTYPNHSPT